MSSEEEMTVLPKAEKGKTVTGYCNNNPVGVEKTTSDGFRCSRRVVDDDDLMTEYVALRKDLHCKYCKKKFSNSQALGGHQNAHKRERALEKMEEIALASVAAASSSFFPPSTLSSPCYTTRPDVPPPATALLGVRSLSAIHKPFIRSWSSSGRGAGGGWWWLPTHSNNLNRRISSTLMAPNPEQPHLPRKTPSPNYYSPGINSTYWVFEHQPQPETTATDFNHGGGGGGGRRLLMAALQPPFAGEGGGSHDDHSENDDKEKEEGEAPEIDLTLTL